MVYAFNKPDRQEHCVIFWDTKNGEVLYVLVVIYIYYIDMDVLLKNIPLVKFIKNTSGTRVVYFP